MSLVTPAYTGGESAVGFAREGTWGTTPTTGSDPNKTFGSSTYPAKFVGFKEETFQPNVNADPQMDDMVSDREVNRIIANGNTINGSLRLNPGPESIGYFLTMMFGTPTTTQVADSSGGGDNDVWQHIWYPGLNTRGNWPVPYSVESRLSAVQSKLIKGMIVGRLGLEIPNNGAAVLTIDQCIAKAIQMLTTASGGTDDEGVALPCKLTASPTFISETEWHFKQMAAYPQIDGVDEQCLQSFSLDMAFPDLRGIFTGGSGANIGTYALDKFQASGRAGVLFQNDDIFYKVKQGTYMKYSVTLTGAAIQGAHNNSLQIIAYSSLAATPGIENRVGDLAYDLGFQCRKDPTEGKSVQITLINSVSSYA
jgi:hypothetical protein